MSSDMIRVTGLNSGLDTESIISAYTSKASKRVQDAKNELKLNEWKQDTWKTLNSKIYSFYSKTLSANRMNSAYAKTKVTTSNDALSVVGSDTSAKGVQTAKILGTASAAYLTGSKIAVESGADNLADTLGIEEGKQITYTDKTGKSQTIQIGGTASDGVTVVNTMNDLMKAFKNIGLNANYDEANQRIFLSAKSTGESHDFDLGGDVETLKALGFATADQLPAADAKKAASKVDGTSAKLVLNNAEFVSDTNTFTINGATYTINHMPTDPDEEISVTTSTDYEGVYNLVKDMIKEYNDLVNEMSKFYNADAAKGYDPLTDEQKEAMTEKEIEAWEEKIKGGILSGDDTVYDVMMAMVNSVSSGIKVNGEEMHLSDFGISTLGYFDAEEDERYALHIDGDIDDGITGTNTDKLKSMIAADPEAVTSFFTQFSQKLYQGLYAKMGSTSLSSIYKVYNDKQLKTEYEDWEKKIVEYEKQLTEMEDKYYDKFSAMETALAKLNSKQTAVSSMFGMS